METQSSNSNPIADIAERSGRWLSESIIVKLLSIGFLILVMLIPSTWIQSLMYERKERAETVLEEVASKWSGSQTLAGPVLVIPYTTRMVVDLGNNKKEVRDVEEKAFFLPEKLDITGTIKPEHLHRSLFDVSVYESSLKLNSVFSKPDFASLGVANENVLWSEAHLIFGITDIRGISDNPVFKVGNDTLAADPSNAIGINFYNLGSSPTAATSEEYAAAATAIGDLNPQNLGTSHSGMITPLKWTNADSFQSDVAVTLSLKGSGRLDFVPTGKTTDVKLSGVWNSPSFDGEFLPATRDVTDTEFAATWRILHFNRPFSQQWLGNNNTLSNANFGVKLLIPVDQYQKSIRTAKYGILVVLLTFVALFLVEITQRIRIHPFQYILIGAALTIYYTLLLSISEHWGFNQAYIVASVATIILISAYATSFLKTGKLVALFSALLGAFYAFIFVIILQEDYSLLIGSVGLFVIIALIMYFSRKVSWYKNSGVVERS